MTRIFYNNPFTDMMVIDDKEKCHHLAVVVKLRVGEEVYLVNGTKVAKTEIVSIDKSSISLQLIEQFEEDNELDIELTLGFGPLKGDNTQLVVQKAVELGVTNIKLINFRRNVSKFDNKKADKKLAKFEKIIEGACLQSRRNILPTIEANVNLNQQLVEPYDHVFVCYENANSNHILTSSQKIEKGQKVLVLIGPEGGIDETEIENLEQLGAQTVTLGKRIMRAETASISSLGMIGASREGN